MVSIRCDRTGLLGLMAAVVLTLGCTSDGDRGQATALATIAPPASVPTSPATPTVSPSPAPTLPSRPSEDPPPAALNAAGFPEGAVGPLFAFHARPV